MRSVSARVAGLSKVDVDLIGVHPYPGTANIASIAETAVRCKVHTVGDTR